MSGLGMLGMMMLICGPSLGLLLSIIYRDYREKVGRLASSARRKSATTEHAHPEQCAERSSSFAQR